MYAWADGQQSHVGHCCISGISENIPKPDFNHSYLEATRSVWDQAQRKECNQCWDTERRGHTSARQHYITWAKDLKLDPVAPELLRLDFSVGSVCNAKCIMCSAGSSTTWAAEDAKFGHNKYRYNLKPGNDIDQITSIDVSKLKQVYFTGGEPLMSHRVVELLQHVKRTGNITELEFSCNTNGSILPNAELIDLWKQCKSVDVYFSIDGVGREFEYIRNPLKWQEVNSNIRTIKSLGVNINIAVAVGVHNIDIMPDIYAWFADFSLSDSAFGVNKCWGKLSLDSASEALKQVWRQKLQSIDAPWVEQVQSMIQSTGQHNDNLWQMWLMTIDQRRNYSWRNELPQLAIAKNNAVCYTL